MYYNLHKIVIHPSIAHFLSLNEQSDSLGSFADLHCDWAATITHKECNSTLSDLFFFFSMSSSAFSVIALSWSSNFCF